MKFQVYKSAKQKALITAALLSSLLASGCGLRDPRFGLIPQSLGYAFAGLTNNKVDILWVIDNSGTMGPKQTNLANSITSFMTKFQSLGMDYQIAVVTTDIRPIDPAHPLDPNFSGQAGCIVGTPKIITPATANPVTALAANANVGFFGSADAHGLDAVQMALSEPNISNCNAGFLRSDAFLAIVEFSDADDNTTATVNNLITYLDSVKVPAVTATGTEVRSYFASSMIVEDLSKAACIALGPFSEKGVKYIDFANTTGGTVASICDANFSAGLLTISTKILESMTAIKLARVPDVGTIAVRFNGAPVSGDANNGWTFDVNKNSVFFHGTSIPQSGTLITVDYTPTDIVR